MFNLTFNKIMLFLVFFLGYTNVVSANSDSCKLPDMQNSGLNVTLNTSCIYHGELKITKSGTHLNCQGATLDGGNIHRVGILVTGKGKKISDVKIINCKIINYLNSGIRITNGIKAQELSEEHDLNYSRSPEKITLTNIKISNSGRVAVFFDSYTTNSIIEDSEIDGSGGPAIYLEHSSQKIEVLKNFIINNADTNNRQSGSAGIHIDSSANNLIKDNYFSDNKAGGVFLYKNCSEKFSNGKSVIRWQHSDYNTIINNIFSEEEVGVWIAARQSKNLSKWDCGDSSMDGKNKFYEDFANNNLIKNNKFCNNKISVRIEGDNNEILGNSYNSTPETFVQFPESMREKIIGKPVIGNKVEKNTFKKCD
ncbi:right-handed parallel beta-helix repeat-containing protein [Rahnella bruchi]|uniref:right-handed parallel beta-helix repeat-containing protein n=1 Tax=Rahnella bruchi TaxID=1510573 RepID=UPI000EA1F347|nr:right-handed parallel beta-helix repeat-containing protein [Rahnella bruchi]